ncbi:MAG: 50S ribosomal protein L5 [Myxococcota bacterium]
MTYVPRMKTRYREEAIQGLKEEFNYTNPMQVPKLLKVIINTTTKDAVSNSKILNSIAEEVTLIAGQKAVITKARRSIATYKLRDGMPLGVRVTLRGDRMWEFYDRLVTLAIPRIRDFRGVSAKAFDGRGNYALGITEQIIFPEIEYDKVSRITGMNINFVTSAQTDEEGRALLRLLGMPFAN